MKMNRNEMELYGNAFYRYIPGSQQLIPIHFKNKQLQYSWIYIGKYRTYPFFPDIIFLPLSTNLHLHINTDMDFILYKIHI